jgi:predicted porin
MAVAGACALFGATSASAVGFKAGDWDLSIGGEVNGFLTRAHCDNNAHAIALGLACTTTNEKSATAVQSGLLPSALVISAKTTQEGFDIGVTFGMYPGINSQVGNANSAGNPVALGTDNVDFRQNFLTFGDKDMGTIKIGRDLGIFGSDAILNDMTLLGVGSPQATIAPSNTTLGRIGIGYIYADFMPQISYISPSVSGLQGTLGIFSPLNFVSVIGPGVAQANSTPMLQGKLTYDYDLGGVTGRGWTGFAYEHNSQLATGRGATGYVAELGAKAAYSDFEGLVYAYKGRGVGTTGLFIGGLSPQGNRRNSYGGYAQLAYHIGKWKPAVSFGMSRLKWASGENATTAPGLVFTNKSGIAAVYYSLTKALTLVGEFALTKSTDQVGNANTENSISAGAILFF